MPTHGSLTKAGKVRVQTPKVTQTSETDSKGPLRSYTNHYYQRIVYQPEDRRYRRWRR
ncbi:MAG: 30S ribosomal protein S30e [Candidatus Bathyarchaeota archaeon]